MSQVGSFSFLIVRKPNTIILISVIANYWLVWEWDRYDLSKIRKHLDFGTQLFNGKFENDKKLCESTYKGVSILALNKVVERHLSKLTNLK